MASRPRAKSALARTTTGEMRVPEHYRRDMLVDHPGKPQWGPGRILAVDGKVLTIYFRDAPKKTVGEALKRIDTSLVTLGLARLQSDPMLEHLPPLENGKLPLRWPRLTLDQATTMFFRRFPSAFTSPDYDHHERGYKVEAHRLWTRTLGGRRGRDLLTQGATDTLVERALAVEGKLNLLSQYERMAIREALRDRAAAGRFFSALFPLLDAGKPSRPTFDVLIEMVMSLPAAEGRARVATWPILTLFPYIADPKHHMFLKPGVTQLCADVLAFDLQYSSTLNWTTYSRLLEMAAILLAHLRPRGARDFIDIQSFIWVTSRLAAGKYGRAFP